ncbi:Os03g0764500, partial [Oryza sativa Japonica Group]
VADVAIFFYFSTRIKFLITDEYTTTQNCARALQYIIRFLKSEHGGSRIFLQ